MRYRFLSFVFIVFMLASCSKPVSLVITNPSLLERNNTLAEISLADLGITAEQLQTMSIRDEQGNEVAYQLLDYDADKPASIVFLVDNIRGGMRREFTLRKRKPSPVPVLCTAQYVPERKDDFAWENDLAAYRMYGPALAAETPSNGVDLWLKCTEKPVVAKFYDDDLHHSKPYHVNHGEGLDCYKVAHTLGCGGIAPYRDGKLCVGDHFADYSIILKEGLRVVFQLDYPTHKLVVTCDAGALMNKAEVYVKDSTIAQMAAGIYLHDKLDNTSFSEQAGWVAYAENAVSDAGEPQGRNYCAVYMPEPRETKVEDGHLLVVSNVPESRKLTYWFGGGWSQWHYPTDADWFSAIANTCHNALLPLQIKVVK